MRMMQMTQRQAALPLLLLLALAQKISQCQAVTIKDMNWGSFYDPKSEFCGDHDCYKILGFNYEDYIDSPNGPPTKEITKNYRALSRKWHPDKTSGADEIFVKIAKAYEIMTNDEKRREYDYLRDRPDEYYYRYGSNMIWKYAPQSNLSGVVILLLTLFSVLGWFVQLNHWQQIADVIIKAAVEDLGSQNGGSDESIEIREKAMQIWEEERDIRLDMMKFGSANGKDSKKQKNKMTKQARKQLQNEELRPIITKLVNEIDDFGGGYCKPEWKDLFAVRFVQFPYHAIKKSTWMVNYFIRRQRGLPYTDEELEYRTIAAIGNVAWDAALEEDHEEMKKRELWIPENLEAWEEHIQTRHFSAGDMKRYNRWKKKQGTKME